MTTIAAHLQTCRDCSPRRLRRGALLAVLVVGCVAIAAVVWTPWRQRTRFQNATPAVTPLQSLASAAPRHARTHEARLTEMPWAPYRGTKRGSDGDVSDYQFEAVVAGVAAGERSGDPAAVHVAAVAHMLASRTTKAVTTIRRAIDAAPADARLHSDAAAIVMTESLESTRPDELPVALAHADAALRTAPALPEALFNRALILERMGLRLHALAAWRAYLAVDPDSAWADEARTHVQQLDRPTDSQQFRAALPAAEAAAARGDAEAVRAFVTSHRQLSRAWCEVETLGKWAEAVAAGNAAAAEAQLRFAGMVATALTAINGETLLADAVTAAENATGPARTALVDAHVTYLKARRGLRADPAGAEPLLAASLANFDAAGSPMALVAGYYHAIALYNTQRLPQAKTELQQVASSCAPSYRALFGSVQWQLGMCHYALGDWNAALAAYQLADGAFRDLGEGANGGFMKILLADWYDTVGDRERAWAERVYGFAALSDAGRDDRLHVSISGAARAELQAGRNDAAASLLAVASEEAKIAAGPETAVLSYASLALLRAGGGDAAGASAALDEGRAAVAKLPASVAARAKAALQVAEAAVILQREPERALTLLREAENHYSRSKRRAWLPGVHLQQGRALRRLGRDEEALRRLTAGIHELEKQRATVSDADLRATVFDGAESLFTETIDLLTRRRAQAAAFDLAERFRARTLLEELSARSGASLPGRYVATAPPKLPPDVAVLEYVVLQDRLICFSIRGGELQTFVVDVTRERLETLVAGMVDAIRRYGDEAALQKASSALRDVLVAPATRAVSGAGTLIFVPDRFLQQVPFSALYDADSRRYLMQDHAIAVAPSLRLLETLARKAHAPASLDALVIGNPFTGGELEPLPSSEREARAVASMYGRSSLLLQKDATRERFVRDWSRAAVVHFGGHATMAASRGAAASLALASERRADHMAAHEIARLEASATRLVVLAACDSFGRGREHLETTPTLAHAFLAAGVPTVVGALWPINDEPARELFRTFHRHWTAGDGNVASSLRQAQLALLTSSDPALRHPASWAGVAVLGDPFQHHSRPQE